MTTDQKAAAIEEQESDKVFEDVVKEEEPPEPGFDGSLVQAAWAMKHLHKLEARKREIAEFAQKEIDVAELWRDSEIDMLTKRGEYFRFLLEQYHRIAIEEDPYRKTLKLPHGKTTIRAQQPDYEKDEGVLLAWAQKADPEQLNYWKIEAKVRWGMILKAFTPVEDSLMDTATGECVQGVTVIPRAPKFNIKINED